MRFQGIITIDRIRLRKLDMSMPGKITLKHQQDSINLILSV